MIVRLWRGVASAAQADTYQHHFEKDVAPTLAGLPGQRGAVLLRRPMGDSVEFLAVTFWESLAAIQAFAGADVESAVVEPAARAALSDFDDFVRHFEVAYGGFPTAASG